jgi:diguanylate cyclase (GGDEF)-like protein
MSLEAALLSLTGLTVGDAFGQSLYFPGAEKTIQQRQLPPAPWRWTDDTQMALSVVEELHLRGWIDQDYLARRMAWRYTTDPARGYGVTTGQVLAKIAQGEYFRVVSKSIHNGGSWGCSVAARATPLGAYFCGMPAQAAREAPLAAAITHSHPESLAGVQAVAAAAALAGGQDYPRGTDFLHAVLEFTAAPDSRVHQAIKKVMDIPAVDLDSCLKYLFTDQVNSVQNVVPFALWCAAHHMNDYKEALWVAVSAKGNCDTTCAIVGGIVALTCKGVPDDWKVCREPLPDSALLQEITLKRESQEVYPPFEAGQKDAETKSTRTPLSVRTDPLTGLPNLMGLLEQVERLIEQPENLPFCLLLIHLVPLWDVNRNLGRTSGDNLICEIAETLQKIGVGPVFRSGGDKFAVLLRRNMGGIKQAHQIARLITRPGCRLPRTALIHFPFKEEAFGGRLMACLIEALRDQHYQNNDGLPREFNAPSIRARSDFSWMMVDLAEQIRQMGKIVDEANRLAQTDAVSQLPNLRVAMTTLESTLKEADEHQKPFAILLFDGDNLRKYNQVSFEAGDEAIRQLGSTLKNQIRQSDYIARWRTGDEFLVILPATDEDEALQIGNRMCQAVTQASRSWLFPSSISGGLAIYPAHGLTLQDLLHNAEKGLKTAKEGGKNRVIIANSNN